MLMHTIKIKPSIILNSSCVPNVPSNLLHFEVYFNIQVDYVPILYFLIQGFENYSSHSNKRTGMLNSNAILHQI